MNGSKLRILLGTLGVLVSFLLVSFYSTGSTSLHQHALALPKLFDRGTPDHMGDSFTTIIDDQGKTLSMMARTVFTGDQLYTAEGHSYRISRVEGDQAEAQFLGMDPQIVAYNELYANQVAPVTTNLAEQKSPIAIYHTHSDESYVPSDGSESIAFKGGIYQVGKALVDKLQGKGVAVSYDETPHDPHDNNAYVRSRRTAANLMKSNPSAIFDVHRDGVPDPSYYRATVDGQKIAKLRLVVGRENPRMDANMDFAKRMMAAANNMHNQVVKEIFVGKGDYNQDLTPTALLIEAGTHTNTKEEAAMGVALFSEAVPSVLGIAAGATSNPAAQAPGAGGKPAAAAGGAGKALAWILGITIVGGVGFLLISSGSWENARKRVTGFGREFTSFFGPRPAARKNVKPQETPGRRSEPEEQDPLASKALKDAKDEITKD